MGMIWCSTAGTISRRGWRSATPAWRSAFRWYPPRPSSSRARSACFAEGPVSVASSVMHSTATNATIAELGVLGALTLTVGGFAALLAIHAIAGMGDDAGKCICRRRQACLAGYSAAGRSRMPDVRISLGVRHARDQVPATASLVASAQSSEPSAVISWTRLCAPPMTSPETSLATIQSAPLRGAWPRHYRRPGPSPQRSRPGASAAARLAPSSARMSGLGSNWRRGGPSAFLSFVGEGSTLQSATAATRIAASAGRAASPASPFSRPSRHMRSTPPECSKRPARTRAYAGTGFGGGSGDGVALRPEERFAITRTGSIGSCVGPAVTGCACR